MIAFQIVLHFLAQAELDEHRKKFLSEREMKLRQPSKELEITLPVHGFKTEFSPMIAESAKCTVAEIGSEARFQVRLASMPEPEVAWYKNGELIGPRGGPGSPKYRFYYESRAHSHTRGVVISPVDVEDAGHYELRAWNRLGQVTSCASLRLKGKRVFER